LPGRLRTNFRAGNLAEDLGVLLLKAIAAVADVPRTEDVGIDVVGTLLRRDSDGNCYAEDEFVAQLKSESETTIRYRDHELAWFLAQSQPMFIALVSKKNASIALYPTVRANQAVFALPTTQVTIHCGHNDRHSWVRQDDNSVAVWLGPPLLSWTLKEIDDTGWLAKAYAVFKRFLVIARGEFQLLSIGQFSTISWSTNDSDSICTFPTIVRGHPDKFRQAALQSIPALTSVMFNAISLPEGQGDALTLSLLAVAGSLRDLGVDIGSSQSVVDLALIKAKHRAVESG